jgi:hypothetical protein
MDQQKEIELDRLADEWMREKHGVDRDMIASRMVAIIRSDPSIAVPVPNLPPHPPEWYTP